jgi:hypothetical protein
MGARKSHEPRSTQLIHPTRIETHLSQVRVKDLEHLLPVGGRICLNFTATEGWPSSTFSTRITDHRREVSDQKYHLMTALLKLAELVQQNGMPQVQIW